MTGQEEKFWYFFVLLYLPHEFFYKYFYFPIENKHCNI